MLNWTFRLLALTLVGSAVFAESEKEGLPLYYWQQSKFVNFGDYLSLKLVERIVDRPVRVAKRWPKREKMLLGIGSILSFAAEGDVIWGTGVNGKLLKREYYTFKNLDVRSVRGPLTRKFLRENFQIECPEIYGDPALLFPYFFPEFQRSEDPSMDYLIIVHYSETGLFPREPHIVYSTDPWEEVVQKILDSRFVISTSLHGVIIAESYGIPARYLRVTNHEPLFKYEDYYLGTQRPSFRYARSIEEALTMGGEPPVQCDLEKLYNAFPFEFWNQHPK